MKFPIPESALAQHTAVFGKTGSGKTSTAKLIVEHVAEQGARVCVLDPIKSDWWGLISSADGKHAGLPFYVLGGPRGHVPLHASAGKAIGELVARGDLPLSIIDMADFEPGGHQRFFVDFANILMRRMRGVLYLVVEEAHEFAPKERAGIGAENLSIHYAKKLATAGRSKGVRLLVVTHRVQALHNAVLGSCETVIAHRLTAPADQTPIVNWLKANVRDAKVREEVTGSLSALRTGTGWLCSGEAQLFERIEFPRIRTYDNTATPTEDGEARDVKTAAVDRERLTAIIGTAIEEAKANDPAELKKRIAELERQAARPRELAIDTASLAKAREEGEERGWTAGIEYGERRFNELRKAATAALERQREDFIGVIRGAEDLPLPHWHDTAVVKARLPGIATAQAEMPRVDGIFRGERLVSKGDLPPVCQRVINALAELEQIGAAEPARELLAFMAGYTHVNSKGIANAMGALRTAGLIEYRGGSVALTETGRAHALKMTRPRTETELQERIIGMLGGATARVLRPLIEARGHPLSRDMLATASGYGHLNSKGFANAMGRLRTLGFIDYTAPGMVAAQPILFMERA